MKSKSYLILGVLIILIIIGVALSKKNSSPEIKIETPYDTAIIEATVLSVDLIGSENPSDRGQIRIDSISDYVRNPKADYAPLQDLGSEIFVDFTYTARPAKIRCESIPNIGVGSNETQKQETAPLEPENEEEYSQPRPVEDGYFIYTYGTGNCPEEITLPGVKEGDRIRFSVSYNGDEVRYVGKYEVIP